MHNRQKVYAPFSKEGEFLEEEQEAYALTALEGPNVPQWRPLQPTGELSQHFLSSVPSLIDIFTSCLSKEAIYSDCGYHDCFILCGKLMSTNQN